MIPEAIINATPLDTMPMTTAMWLQTVANRPVATITLCASSAAAISSPVGEQDDDEQAEDCGAELRGSGHERRSQN